MKVLMLPLLKSFRNDESGIKRVIEAYHRYAKEFDIEYIEQMSDDCDITVTHAGTLPGADVAVNHGLYWTADYEASKWEWDTNREVIQTLRLAKEISVPSNWVAETLRREMRVNPHIIGHGIEWDEWQGNNEHYNYVVWNKNRMGDVCSPTAVAVLAKRFPNIKFFTTFYPKDNPTPDNVRISGMIPHDEMKKVVQSAGIYLATTKETFGIGVLEAMASGVPVLAFAWGGNLDLIQHGVNGYLAAVNNYEDLCNGMDYCIKHAKVLGNNGRELAKQWTWRNAVRKVRHMYDLALDKKYRIPLKIPESEYR